MIRIKQEFFPACGQSEISRKCVSCLFSSCLIKQEDSVWEGWVKLLFQNMNANEFSEVPHTNECKTALDTVC